MNRTNVIRAAAEYDWERYLQERGADVEERNGQISGTCPFCNWKRTSFYVAPDSGLYICHACGEKGNGIGLISKLSKVDYEAAEHKLLENFIVDYDDDDYGPKRKEIVVDEDINLPEEFRPLFGKEGSLVAEPYLRYARSRGLDDSILLRYNIGYCASGFYGGRIIVPVTSFGKVVSFVARAIGNLPKKVLTPKGNKQSSYLFNLDNIWGRRNIVIVEGVFDALTAPDFCVATFGKKISINQVALLKRAGVEKVVFCYDADALAETEKFAEMYSMAFDVGTIKLPEGKDPSDLGSATMNKTIRTYFHLT